MNENSSPLLSNEELLAYLIECLASEIELLRNELLPAKSTSPELISRFNSITEDYNIVKKELSIRRSTPKKKGEA